MEGKNLFILSNPVNLSKEEYHLKIQYKIRYVHFHCIV